MSRKVIIPETNDLRRFSIPSNQVGIYVLWDKDEAVYVGQSTNIHYRLSQHHNDGKKVFDSYSLIPKIKDDLDSAEKYYIMKLQPKYNKIVPGFINIRTLLSKVKMYYDGEVNMKLVRAAIVDLNIPMFVFRGVEMYDGDNAGIIAHKIHCSINGLDYEKPNLFICRSNKKPTRSR